MPYLSWKETLLVAAAYLAASEGAMQLLPVAADAPMVSPATAVGLAAYLLCGLRAAWGVFAGATVYRLLAGNDPAWALLSALSISAEIGLAWWLLARVAAMNPRLERLSDVVKDEDLSKFIL